jgi:lysyl-tRNA synthetase class I
MYTLKGTTLKGKVAITTLSVSVFFSDTLRELLDSTSYVYSWCEQGKLYLQNMKHQVTNMSLVKTDSCSQQMTQYIRTHLLHNCIAQYLSNQWYYI